MARKASRRRAREQPDLILMDISIPVIDGWEATQVLKHDPKTREIPIIALTAHALASDREKAMEVGCDGYLAKPCEPRAVVAEVQRFLGKSDGRTPVSNAPARILIVDDHEDNVELLRARLEAWGYATGMRRRRRRGAARRSRSRRRIWSCSTS